MAHSTTNTATRGLTLLSLDSGRFENMTCLSQLFILRENIRTFEIDNDRVHDSVKVHEVFDLIVGTGSGGLVACLVGPLNMLVSEAIEAYIRIHTAVFIPDEKAVLPEERTRRLRKALRALIEEKLAPEHQVADFSDFTRVIPDCKIVITALPNVHVEAPIPFRSFRGRRVSPPPCTLLEAILCTLAHARLFTDVSLCEGSITQSFIAADLGHCNPLESLVDEVQDQFRKASISLIVSLGTGRPLPNSLPKGGNFLQAASNVAAGCREVAERFEKTLQGHSGLFVRVDVEGIDGSQNPSAGDVMVHSRAYIKRQEVKEKMDTIIDGLNGRKCILKVSEIVFPKAGQLERLAADVSHMRAAMDSSNLDDIINWLSAGYTIEDELSSFITPQGGDSGNWLIESEEMDHWVLGYYRLLLLKGPPGCGKTTLASIVVARLRDLQQSAVFPIFIKYSGIFTKFTVFSRLVVQLLRCVATVPPKLEELYQSKLQPDILVLASILTSMLESWEYPIFIVLDALDEFTSSSQRDLVSDLLELAPNVQVFVTSRQIPESICTSQRLIALHGSNHADLGRYIHSQVSMLPYLTPSGAKEELTDKVMKASRGIFLLASLHMQELRECRSLMRAQDVAEQLPTTPEERYHLSIERLKSKPSHDRLLAIHTLMWVWIAKRRLTLGEISHAVASSTHDLTDRCVEDALVPEAILLSLCDGLVVAANDYIEFIHITTQEFLNSFGPEIFKAMLPIVGPGCLGYLNASRPSTVIANWSQQPSESDLKSLSSVEHRFFYYCAALWGEHAREGSAQYLRHFIRLLESSERYHICVRIRFKQEPDSHWPAAWSPQYTPLHLAASLGLGDCVEYLIQGSHAYLSPINIISTGPALIEADVRDNQGHSPLSRASQHGHTGVVQFLLAQTTVDANSQDEMGRSPLTWACMCGHVDTVRLLLSIETLAINMCDNQRHSPLAYACTKGHLEIVRLLLAQDSLEVNTCDKWGYLPVTRACGGDHADVVRLLLTQGTVDVNTLDPNGQSPLAWACERGHVDIVQLLLARNSVEVNTRDKWSYSPLVKACDGGHADIVRLLLQRSDIEVNAPDLLGQSPLARACDAGHAGIVQLLLARETLEVNARDKWGYSALVRACDRGNLDIVQLLLTQDALDVNTPDLSGRSPLARACDKGYTDIVRLLLNRGTLDINTLDGCGDSPLARACDRGHADIIRLLLTRKDLQVDYGGTWKNSPLGRACNRNYPGIVQLLLEESDMAVEVTAESGELLRVWAHETGRSNIIQILNAKRSSIHGKEI